MISVGELALGLLVGAATLRRMTVEVDRDVGWTLVLAGSAVARRSPWAAAVAAIYPAAVAYWLPWEEAHLEVTFGQRYSHYRDTTPRWLGLPDTGSTR